MSAGCSWTHPCLCSPALEPPPASAPMNEPRTPVATMRPRLCFFAYDILYEQFTVMDTKGGMVMCNVNNTCTWRCVAAAMVNAGAAPGLFIEGNNNSTPQRPMTHLLVYHCIQCLDDIEIHFFVIMLNTYFLPWDGA